MESPSPEKMKCPTPETLSAVFDRECSDELVLQHIKDCKSCQAHLDELKDLDNALKQALERETPSDISERILAGIKSREKGYDRKFTSSRVLVFTRVAALAAVLGVVGYMIYDDTVSARDNEPVRMQPRVAQSAGIRAELGAPESAGHSLRRFGAVDAADLAAASFSSSPVQSDIAPCAVIPDEVRHVWSVPVRATDFRQSVISLIHTLGISSDAVQIKQEEDQFSIRFQGTKMQAVKFVKKCKQFGFSLLSPVQPQPEQNTFAGSADAEILYEASFVSR